MSYRYRREALYPDGMPQTVLRAPLEPRVDLGHWTAGRRGRDGALSTIYDVLIGLRDRSASYHEIAYWERSTREFVVIECVRSDRAAHSVNPRQPPNGPWNPSAELRAALGDRWWDPNAHAYARAYAGMPADLEADLADPDFRDAMARWTRETLDRFPSVADRPLFTHGMGQPANRYDWWEYLPAQLYQALAAPQEEPVTSLGLPRVKGESWSAPNGAPIYELALGPRSDESIVKGADVVTLAETRHYRVVCLGSRPVQIDGETYLMPDRIGISPRSRLDPDVQGGDPEFEARTGATLYGWEPKPAGDVAALEEQRNNALRKVGEIRVLAVEELSKARVGASDLEEGLAAAIERVEKR